ncbi:unnamed protein product [Sphagnum tenellum]
MTCSAATGGNGTYIYQWQQSTNGSTWSSITNTNTQNYTPGNLTALTYFQRLVTSNNAPAQSNISTITVSPALVAGSISPTSQTTRYNSAPLTNLVATIRLQEGAGFILINGRPRWTILLGLITLNSSQGTAYNYTIANTFRIPGITSVTNAQVAAMSNCQRLNRYTITPRVAFSGTQQSNGIINTDAAYANTNYEPSPLNRPIEQGAPGDAWQLSTSGISGSGYTVKIAYGTNSNEVIMWAINSAGNGAGYTGNYPAGTLYKTTTTDENGNNSIEYKDLRNDVVCKMAQNGNVFLATYYIYDDYNNLAYVVPPIPSSSIPGQPSYPASFLETDQVIFTQDANEAALQEVSFTKYDALGQDYYDRY